MESSDTVIPPSEVGQMLQEDPDAAAAIFSRMMRAIRVHLGMEVAFVSEFVGARRYFRHVDTEHPQAFFSAGLSDSFEESVCARVADGRIPELLHDARHDPEVACRPITGMLPIGAHLSVPIRLSDGRIFGTFCCFASAPKEELDARDLDVMRVFADIVAAQVDRDLIHSGLYEVVAARIEAVLRTVDLHVLYQPIVNVAMGRVVGFEALARFHANPVRAPDVWFAEATSVGRGIELESLAIRLALQALDRLPDDIYVAVNASPATVVGGALGALLVGAPLQRVVVEVTEHEAIEQYDELVAAVRPLQERGLRIAIDDAGAGYASFRHILNLAPHMIKLDVSITRGIDADRSRRALAAALHRFAEETGCRIVAEGVETAAELDALRALGFTKAQGYYLGRPMTLEQAVLRCAQAGAPAA